MHNAPPSTPAPSRPAQAHNGPKRGYGQFGQPTYTQAQRIIAKFGGEAKLAKLLGINRSTPYRWCYARPYGSDGLIPSEMVDRVRKAARLEGIFLSPEDWMPTRAQYPSEPAPEVA